MLQQRLLDATQDATIAILIQAAVKELLVTQWIKNADLLRQEEETIKEAAAQEKSAIHSTETIARQIESVAALFPIARQIESVAALFPIVQQKEGAVNLLKERLLAAADCLDSWASAKKDLAKNRADLLNQKQAASVGSVLRNQIQVSQEASQELAHLAIEKDHLSITEKERH